MPLRSPLERHFQFWEVALGRPSACLSRLFSAENATGSPRCRFFSCEPSLPSRMLPPVLPTRLLLLCAALICFSSCAVIYSAERPKRYSVVRVTDIEGHLIGQWIAEGFVAQTEHGYKFKAVERLSGP